MISPSVLFPFQKKEIYHFDSCNRLFLHIKLLCRVFLPENTRSFTKREWNVFQTNNLGVFAFSRIE